MENRYAVIDLGTNTFHLLAIEMLEGEQHILHKERIFVQLAEDGIKTIGEKPMKRAKDALIHFAGILEEFGIRNVRAFGTAGLRTASNGTVLVNQVKEDLGLEIDVISGDEEARLIHKGVMKAIAIPDDNFLIMDIGGGSTEFIIANEDGVIWSQSFPLGVAVLYNGFQKNDPISQAEIETLYSYLDGMLKPLKENLLRSPVRSLVGASGTFDVLERILEYKQITPNHSSIDISLFQPLYDRLIPTNLEERLGMTDIPETRAKLIVVALVLIKYVLDISNVETIDVSSFAMKEGILGELIED